MLARASLPSSLFPSIVALVAAAAACGSPSGPDAGGAPDLGATPDAAMSDAGPDAAGPDAGRADLGTTDGGPVDAGPFDAGPRDLGSVDAGDAGGDEGLPDLGVPPTLIRVVHASPDAPLLDVRVQGSASLLADDLAYGDASAYGTAMPGPVTLEAVDASTGGVVASEDVSLVEGTEVTVVVAGLFGSTAPADELRLLALEEGFAAPGPAEAQVRVVHAGSDAPDVDIDVGLDGTAELTGLARFDASPAAGLGVDVGATPRLEVADGTDPVSTFTIDGLVAGDTVFVIATGLVDRLPRQDDGFALLAVLPGDTTSSPTVWVRQDPRLHILHLALDLDTSGGSSAEDMDIFLDDEELVAAADFGTFAGPFQRAPRTSGALDFFEAAPGPMRPAGSPDFTDGFGALTRGERYLLVAIGIGSSRTVPFEVVAMRPAIERDAGQPTRPRVMALHGGPDANPMVRPFRADPPITDPSTDFTTLTVLDPLAYGVPSAPAGVTLDETGQVVFGVGDGGSSTVDAWFAPFDFSGGFARYLLIAGGAVDVINIVNGFPPVQLVVVEVTDDHEWIATTLPVVLP